MASYDTFAKYYDLAMDDRVEDIRVLRRLIARHVPSARSILELACGSGILLEPFAKRAEIFGLDLSANMLKIARRRLPKGHFKVGDMRAFRYGRTFDLILLPFSINHLSRFSDWERTFATVRRHLAPGGVFILTYFTQTQFERLDGNMLIKNDPNGDMILVEFGRGRGGNYTWKLRGFEKTGKDLFRLHEDIVHGTTFPLAKVERALQKRFARVRMLDANGRGATGKTDFVYAVCS